jgi:hypothetical protein
MKGERGRETERVGNGSGLYPLYIQKGCHRGVYLPWALAMGFGLNFKTMAVAIITNNSSIQPYTNNYYCYY